MTGRSPISRRPADKKGKNRLDRALAVIPKRATSFQNDERPVLLLEVFAKNEQANLSKAQCNALAKAIAALKAARKKNK